MIHGSSPHARGTRRYCCSCECIARFIPACAGNAFRRVPASGLTTVHPRMRGERRVHFKEIARRLGSSPHARGTLSWDQQARSSRRFIPACAGNAHEGKLENPFATGSSPHARGTQSLCLSSRTRCRFIPACAGNAESVSVIPYSLPVHPRMRGERHLVFGGAGAKPGSSPHARGTPGMTLLQAAWSRFIPACAGNALREYATRSLRNGSSPHARGTPLIYSDTDSEYRFIPACAGNALP